MAVTTGTITNIHTTQSEAVTSLQVAEVEFTMSGTYAQADDSKVAAVGAAISASRRNGKTVTLVDAMFGQPANKASALTTIMAGKTVAISTDDITFELTDGDYATEYADATAIAAQSRPFRLLVSFTEA